MKFIPVNKLKLDNLISKYTLFILSFIGKNLPKHVALYIMRKEENYFIHEKSLILSNTIKVGFHPDFMKLLMRNFVL